MLKVGLTGGIGCGKTAVASLFSSLGVPVLDADAIAHSLVEPGQPALTAIVQAFGPLSLKGDRLDRAWLRDRVFNSTEDKRRLENIVHPRVYAAMEAELTRLDSPYCLLVIPLLLETSRRDFVDRLLVVDCPVELQIARVTRRDGQDESAVRRIIEAQVSRSHRIAAADDVLENAGDLANLSELVEKLHSRYLELAREGRT